MTDKEMSGVEKPSDLIECGDEQDVDLAALLEIADELQCRSEYAKSSPVDANSIGIVDGIGDAPERIRKAVEGAPKLDADRKNMVIRCRTCRTRREAAADWVEAQGGLDVVKAVSDVLRECVERRDEVLAKLGIEADDEDSESTHDAIMKELDKRLMPCDLTWPCWDDGLPVTRDDAPEHVTAVALYLDGSGYGLLDAIIENAAGERVKRPEPEVLGADGLPACAPMTVGEAVFGVDHASAQECAQGAPQYAAGGVLNSVDEGVMVEAGEWIIPLSMAEKLFPDGSTKYGEEVYEIDQARSDHEKAVVVKTVCQNTAKTETKSRLLKEDRTAEYMRYLGYGA